MNDILKALDRNESVTVLYHGKVKGIIKPVREKTKSKIKDHPFFGMYKEPGRVRIAYLSGVDGPVRFEKGTRCIPYGGFRV